jgi:hypothetical protein
VCLAATWLVRSGAQDAAEVVEARLRRASVDEPSLAACLISALQLAAGQLPEDLRQRFSQPDAPWEIRVLTGRNTR